MNYVQMVIDVLCSDELNLNSGADGSIISCREKGLSFSQIFAEQLHKNVESSETNEHREP